jgi:hypothetical protein
MGGRARRQGVMVFSVVRLQGGKLEFKLRHAPHSWVAIVSHCPLDSDF